MINDRLQYYWITLKTAYSWVSWYIEEHGDEIYDIIDWSMDFMFDEKIREQGINPVILEELRQKRLNKFGEFLVIIIMIAVCLKMIRNATKRSFYEELKFRQRERQRKEFLRSREKNLSENWNVTIATSHTKGAGRGRGQRKSH
ncbi:uncharacterized protein LOC110047521 [Orbicella faveolata]|uniref:uncharacterized protein LOC110047521 n=1 Tax=Orbicella faveolata TaxID=48498 RepID=UPI0009E650C1|nr:uncharacterized protein LOC110047521 [Orbicella faveolata]